LWYNILFFSVKEQKIFLIIARAKFFYKMQYERENSRAKVAVYTCASNTEFV